MELLSELELGALKASKDEAEYAVLARGIKATHGGGYPRDWYAQVIAPGGVLEYLRAKWNKPEFGQIKVGFNP
jgi:hypothetical protein